MTPKDLDPTLHWCLEHRRLFHPLTRFQHDVIEEIRDLVLEFEEHTMAWFHTLPPHVQHAYKHKDSVTQIPILVPYHHTPDHFVSLGLAFLENNRSTPLRVWGHDHDGAYRQLPLHDPRQAYVLLLTPDGPTLWSHNVLLFGSAASVWSYNRFGDVLVACSRTLVLSPALHYVDDYGSMEDELSAESSFRAFEDYNGCLQISMKPSKRQPPEKQHRIQGVLISSDTKNLILTPCPARVRAMTQQIEKHLDTNILTPEEARKMAGKCNFLTGRLFGKVGRAPLKAIYTRANSFSHQLDKPTRSDGTPGYYYTLPAHDHPTEPNLSVIQRDLHRRLF